MKCSDAVILQNQLSPQAGVLVVKGGAKVRDRALAGLMINKTIQNIK